MPASITRTTLSAAISTPGERVIQVKSATGFVAGYGLYIDREYMKITSVTGTLIGVRRGAQGTRATPHLLGATVQVAPPNYFTTFDRAGVGTAANELVQPYINIVNGNAWSVVGGVWQLDNEFGGSTNYGLSPAIWADCPLDKMLVDPSYGHTDGDDFTGSSGSPVTTAHKYEWSGANGTLTAVAAVPGGAWLLTATGADNDEIYVHAGSDAGIIKADAASTWWLEARLKISQITLAQGVFFGLHEEGANAATNMTDNTMALAVVDYIGFQIISATDVAAIWQSVHALNAGAHAVVSATAGTATTSYTKLGMKSVLGTVTFYIDGVPLADTVLSSATNFPLDQVMQVAFLSKCGQATANTMTVDWWRAAQTRLAN